jgi:hypothetical protein
MEKIRIWDPLHCLLFSSRILVQEVVDQGGLQYVHAILLNCRTETELVTRSLILLKVLAGNDKVSKLLLFINIFRN